MYMHEVLRYGERASERASEREREREKGKILIAYSRS
jgi:hypothetical protein